MVPDRPFGGTWRHEIAHDLRDRHLFASALCATGFAGAVARAFIWCSVLALSTRYCQRPLQLPPFCALYQQRKGRLSVSSGF